MVGAVSSVVGGLGAGNGIACGCYKRLTGCLGRKLAGCSVLEKTNLCAGYIATALLQGCTVTCEPGPLDAEDVEELCSEQVAWKFNLFPFLEIPSVGLSSS